MAVDKIKKKQYRLGLYEKSMPNELGWREKLQTAKAAGFDFVEISIDESDEKLARLDMTKQERLALVALMEECGIHIETMCLSGHRKYPMGSTNVATRVRSLEIMEKAIIFARDVGIRIIQIAGYDVYYETPSEETERLFAQGLARSVELAAAYGVLLAFETMETEFMNTVEKAMRYIRQIDSPYLAVYPDSGNLANAALLYGVHVLDDLNTGKGHIAALHLKESVAGKFREIPYGMGHVSFSAIIDRAYAMGVRRYLAEFWYVGQDHWREDIRAACTFLRAQF